MEQRPDTIDEASEITLRLEQYDDIFSDFDVRPYSKKALSVDFLEEIKRAAHDKNEDKIELVLLVPEQIKNEYQEAIIKERLKAHFKKHKSQLVNEKKGIRRFGLSMVLMGAVCMIGATYLLSRNEAQSFLSSFLVVFLEPAALFLLWEGMDQIIFKTKEINPELEFYNKMSSSHQHTYFKPY